MKNYLTFKDITYTAFKRIHDKNNHRILYAYRIERISDDKKAIMQKNYKNIVSIKDTCLEYAQESVYTVIILDERKATIKVLEKEN